MVPGNQQQLHRGGRAVGDHERIDDARDDQHEQEPQHTSQDHFHDTTGVELVG
jgi:hypothetical protein